ncbi:MAG: hypothetical protein K2X49_01135 [Acetobacteraceae bacterium]|nr:hypothetical protein [Acetobacteraceae bacterium]
MSNPDPRHPQPSLNPALRNRTDDTYDTTVSSAAPADTASVQRQEGRAWPIIWALVTLVGAALAVWILFL